MSPTRRIAVAGLVALLALTLAPGGRAGPRRSPAVVASLLSVAFSSPSQGVGLFMRSAQRTQGHARCALTTSLTRDGGTRFSAPGGVLSVRACGSTEAVSEIASDGAGDLFAYGPQLIESHNAGSSWQGVHLGGVILAVSLEGHSAWALRSSGCAHGSGMCLLTLFVSTNAGRSWHRSAAQPPARHVVGGPSAGGPFHSTWLLRSSAIAATIVLPPRGRSTSAILEQTTDAGQSWTTERAPCTAGGWSVEYSVTPSGARWLACAGEPAAGNQLKSFAVSPGRGTNWREGPSCGLGGLCRRGMPIGGYLGDLVATGAATAFYVGDRSSLMATHDGGRTWTPERGFSGDASASGGLTFVNAQDGWAIDLGFGAHSVLWRTRDGGAHWTRLAAP